MLLGGAGAALTHARGCGWIGGFERRTQAGYHGWLLMTGVLGLSGEGGGRRFECAVTAFFCACRSQQSAANSDKW